MEATNLPKVSKVLSSKPVSESTAFQAVARFLEKEQKRLDPVAIQQASHLNDVYLVCEALAKGDNEKEQLERLRNSSTIQVEKETKRFQPSNVESSFQDQRLPVETIHSNPLNQEDQNDETPVAVMPQESPVATNIPFMEPAAVKQEFVADEQPSEIMVAKSHDDDKSTKNKRKADKKAKKEKKEKKKKRNTNNE